MQLIALKGVRIMSVNEAKNKIANLYPNLQSWIQKVVPHDHEQYYSPSFKQNLEPINGAKNQFGFSRE